LKATDSGSFPWCAPKKLVAEIIAPPLGRARFWVAEHKKSWQKLIAFRKNRAHSELNCTGFETLFLFGLRADR
jgi:hypothetical protein